MTAHTPGPWIIVENFPCTIWAADPNANPDAEIIADRHSDSEQAKANARLIAAAPDMLAALKTIIEGVADLDDSSWWPCWDMAREAVAKAEGRTS